MVGLDDLKFDNDAAGGKYVITLEGHLSEGIYTAGVSCEVDWRRVNREVAARGNQIAKVERVDLPARPLLDEGPRVTHFDEPDGVTLDELLAMPKDDLVELALDMGLDGKGTKKAIAKSIVDKID